MLLIYSLLLDLVVGFVVVVVFVAVFVDAVIVAVIEGAAVVVVVIYTIIVFVGTAVKFANILFSKLRQATRIKKRFVEPWIKDMTSTVL
jgi:hypothetical protein